MDCTFELKVGAQTGSLSLGDFAKSEVERCRRFQYENKPVDKIGSLEDMRLYVKYDAAGNGSCQIDYVENVTQHRIVSGSTRIGIVDASGAALMEWEQPLFRDCGRNSRSFGAAISRDQAERVTGIAFRTVGNVSAQRC